MSVYFVMAAVAVLLLVLWMASSPVRTAWRRQRLRSQPFPAQWRDILRRRVPYFRQMPVDLQLQLKQHIQVFMAEKPFMRPAAARRAPGFIKAIEQLADGS